MSSHESAVPQADEILELPAIPPSLRVQEVMEATPRSRNAIEGTYHLWKTGSRKPWVHTVFDKMTVCSLSFVLGAVIYALAPELRGLPPVDMVAVLLGIAVFSVFIVLSSLGVVATNKNRGQEWIRFRNRHLRPDAALDDARRAVKEMNLLRKKHNELLKSSKRDNFKKKESAFLK